MSVYRTIGPTLVNFMIIFSNLMVFAAVIFVFQNFGLKEKQKQKRMTSFQLQYNLIITFSLESIEIDPVKRETVL